MKKTEIFSGNHSVDMWNDINKARKMEDVKDSLYFVCCRIQELESKYDEALKELYAVSHCPRCGK